TLEAWIAGALPDDLHALVDRDDVEVTLLRLPLDPAREVLQVSSGIHQLDGPDLLFSVVGVELVQWVPDLIDHRHRLARFLHLAEQRADVLPHDLLDGQLADDAARTDVDLARPVAEGVAVVRCRRRPDLLTIDLPAQEFLYRVLELREGDGRRV